MTTQLVMPVVCHRSRQSEDPSGQLRAKMGEALEGAWPPYVRASWMLNVRGCDGGVCWPLFEDPAGNNGISQRLQPQWNAAVLAPAAMTFREPRHVHPL